MVAEPEGRRRSPRPRGHPAARDPLPEGSLVAAYRIVRPLGAPDARYRAYEAVHERSGRSVALKLVDPLLAAEPAFRERFLNDLLLQAPLRNPHVVRVLDGGTSEHGLYLVTPPVAPLRLAELLGEPLEPGRMLRILRPVAEALDSVHELSLVHGSLQPASVRIAGGDASSLDDFCLSGAGSPFEPPERTHGRPPTVRGDVYALGAVAAICLAHRKTSWDGRMPRVPPPFDPALRRALSPGPADRQRSAGELMQELLAVRTTTAERKPARPPRRRPAPEPARPPRRPRAPSRPHRRGRLHATGAVLAVVAAVTGVLLASSERPAPAPAPPQPQVVGSPVLELTMPPDWAVAGSPPTRPGLEYAEPPVALAPRTSEGLALVAGRVAADAPTFVPAALPSTLEGGLPRPELVTLGDLGALRYDALRPAGEDVLLELYVVPTSAGPVSVSCTAEASVAGLLEACRRVAATLAIRDAEPLELTPDAEYGGAVAAVLGDLVKARGRARARLAAEGSQAREAAKLAKAFAAARAGLGKTTPPAAVAPVHTDILATLKRSRGAYDRLAAAARRRDRAAFRGASRRVAARDGEVRTAVQQLEILGYAVG